MISGGNKIAASLAATGAGATMPSHFACHADITRVNALTLGLFRSGKKKRA